MTELPFDYQDIAEPNDGAPERKCLHPKYRRIYADGGWTCACGHAASAEKVRRGRCSNRRGRRIQKSSMEDAGMTNLPGNLPGLDGARGMFRGESKSGGAFPERLWRWLRAIPVSSGEIPILVVSDAPGPGHKRRAVVVLELSDWRALHGEDAA